MTSSISLPRHWQLMKIAELVSPTGHQIYPNKTPNDIFKYISLEDIEIGTGKIIKTQEIQGWEINNKKITFNKGDILYGRLRPYLQKIIIAPFDGIAATELWPLKASNVIDPEFLQEILLGPTHKSDVARLMTGARMPRIRSEQLLSIKVAVPPIEEQRIIIRALSVIRHKKENIRRNIANGLHLIEKFEQVLLTSVFNGSLSAEYRSVFTSSEDGEVLLRQIMEMREEKLVQDTNILPVSSRSITQVDTQSEYIKPITPNEIDGFTELPIGWAWSNIAQLTSPTNPLCYGVVQPGDEVEQGVPLVRVQDLENGSINSNHLRRITNTIDEQYARSRLQSGDILVSLVGTVGRVAVVPDNLATANIARALAKITPIQPILSQWIAVMLQSPCLQMWLADSARGVARNTLNLSRLAQAPVPLASYQEMKWLLDQIKRRKAVTASMRQKFNDILNALDNLWANVQDQILNGKGEIKEPDGEAVAIARGDRLKYDVIQSNSASGKRKPVTTAKLRGNTSITPKRDLREVLQGHPEGLEPLRLLGEAGYGIQDVEEFYKNLAAAIVRGEIREYRDDEDWPSVVVV